MKRKLLSNNPDEILRIICQRLRISYDFYVREQHKLHPLYPSFRSLAYVLNRLGIDTCLIKTDIEEIKQLPKPLLIEYDGLFLLLENITDTEVHIVNEKNNTEIQPITFLNHFWSGTALIFDTDRQPVTYTVLDKIRMAFNRSMCHIALGAILIAFICFILRNAEQFHILNFAYVITSIVGIGIGTLFQIQEIDRSNALVNSICHSRRAHSKRDCNSILESKDAHFMRLFTWSDFGFLYFLYCLSLLIFMPPSDALVLQIVMSVLAAGYIPYSIYYQWKVAHKWCMLCLMIQGLLFINLSLSVIGLHSVKYDIDWIRLFTSAALGGFVIMAIFTSIKVRLKKYIINKKHARQFMTIKYNHEVRSLLLSSQQRIDTTRLNKIVLNPSGGNTITIIFNTVCNPCINKIRQIMEIFKRKQTIRLELIFLLDRSDITSVHIAQYMLTIFNNQPNEFIPMLCDYISHFPGSSTQLEKYNNIEDKYLQIIAEQDAWCRKNRIGSTPQIFLDGFNLPRIYSIDDIDYMFE